MFVNIMGFRKAIKSDVMAIVQMITNDKPEK